MEDSRSRSTLVGKVDGVSRYDSSAGEVDGCADENFKGCGDGGGIEVGLPVGELIGWINRVK